MHTLPVLWIVVPCYNEEEVLPKTAPMFADKIADLVEQQLIAPDSQVLLVNDGSTDTTWDIIQNLSETTHVFRGICLSRNRGHQHALLAGLLTAKDLCDITISIDADGQDDIQAMDDMVRAYRNGAEIVYGVRASRDTDTWFKRTTAQSYYRLLRHLGADTVYNHADYRLVSARVLSHLADFQEVNIYLRGMLPLVGFNSTCVYYDRHERLSGKSHYPLRKMLSLAFDGITSLSIQPIRLILLFGTLVAALGGVGVLWAIWRVVSGHAVAGWASTVCIVCFFSGVQILSIGIIGEYVGKTYLETKRRPRYIISKTTWDDTPSTRHKA